MNLAAQWVVYVVLAGTFLGTSWWLAWSRARDGGEGGRARRGGVRVLVASFRFADWTIIALGVAFLVPLVVRTIAAL